MAHSASIDRGPANLTEIFRVSRSARAGHRPLAPRGLIDNRGCARLDTAYDPFNSQRKTFQEIYLGIAINGSRLFNIAVFHLRLKNRFNNITKTVRQIISEFGNSLNARPRCRNASKVSPRSKASHIWPINKPIACARAE